ncbi:hypothetical protein JXA40_09740 [bacterium]|nr:hypothetical protein [candidate division CSSED10-310 bacterium]
MFGKKKGVSDLSGDIAMRIVTEGKIRDVSYRELLLSVNMTLEALMSLLAKKQLISPEEMIGELESIRNRKDRKTNEPGDAGSQE